MVDIEETMFYKIKFIDENKEIIKENILNKIEYNDTQISLLLVLVKYLLEDTEYICKEYISIKNFCDENNIQNTPTELADILGIIKVFVNKVYFGTQDHEKLLKKLQLYDNIINNEEKVLTLILT